MELAGPSVDVGCSVNDVLVLQVDTARVVCPIFGLINSAIMVGLRDAISPDKTEVVPSTTEQP